MSSDNIDKVYYSQNNLDNTFTQVCEEINRRTNKDISKNMSYKKSFQSMAKLVFDKCPPNNRNLQNINTNLIDKSVIFFHGKIFEKNVNKPTEKQSNQAIRESIQKSDSVRNTSNQHGFTMMKENDDLKSKYEKLMEQRETIKQNTSDGVNSYMPQNVIKSNNYVKNEIFTKPDQNNNSSYDNQFLRIADENTLNKSTLQTTSQENKQNVDFQINSFNLNDDFTDSLMISESTDSPLYQNIENLQRMDSINPMSMLEDYQRQRNSQVQSYSELEKRQNITSMQTKQSFGNGQSISSQLSMGGLLENQNMVFNRNNTDATTKIDQTKVDPMELLSFGKKLTDNYMERIEERIVNNNEAQPNAEISSDLAKLQSDMIKLQRDSQPKYIEKVHYINVNSVDRLWSENAESRFSYKVQFNQASGFEGAAISQLYKNIVSVELVSAILPMDTTINTFDTRIYGGLMKYPYLLLRIDELDGVFRGTNNWTDRAFSTLLFDKVYFTNTLSTDYISGAATSIVNNVPKTAFAAEYLRGFLKFNPAYFEKKKFYNNPLASLNKMTITITDPRGNSFNTQSDVLSINTMSFTDFLNNIDPATVEITPSLGYPYNLQSDKKMIVVTSNSTFSNRLFRIGDRILFKDFATNTALGGNNSIFNSFINRIEGHIIINLELENNAVDDGNKSFISKLYISPPGEYNPVTKAVDGYYDDAVVDFTGATFGSLINMDLQSHLLFRIVTRDPDTSGTLKPINVY